MARRLAIGSVQLSDRAPRTVAAGGEADLEALVGAAGADLIELRADLCEDPRPETRPALLARLGACGRPVILTARAAAEGGRPMEEARRRALYASGLPHADAIDVEIASTALAAELVPQARAAGKTVVLSVHVLHSTPPAAALLGLIDRAEALGADVTKLVTHARDLDDLRVLLEVTLVARTRGIVTLATGPAGPLPRVVLPPAVSPLTYGHVARPTAPSAQLPLAQPPALPRRFWRRMRGRSARAASATPRARASSLSSRSRRARKRFRACERSRWHLTITPLGRWRSTTQVDTLLTFCPPFPPERTKCSSRSSSRTPSARMRAASACCFPGETGNTRADLPSARSAGHRRADLDFGAAISPIFSTAHPAFQVAGRAREVRRLRPNMSLGCTTASRMLRGAFEYARRNNVLAFDAMTNEFSFHQNVPAIYHHVVGVGAITANNRNATTTWLQKANFSNFGAHVQLVGPPPR